MATQFYQNQESCLNSPADSVNDTTEQSWYRHSGQTGDFSSGRSTSPNSADWRQSAILSSKSSSLDPRRITPTLHASLVSEILNLRRELENKNACIDDLETNLQSNKNELDSVNDRLTRFVRDTAIQKKKSDEAERHLYHVTEGLMKERDQALSSGKDLRSRLNTLTTKTRRQEEDFERWQSEWEQQKNSWALERQTLQHRVTLTENHLRSLVDDLQAKQQIADDAVTRSGQPSSGDGRFSPTTPLRNSSPTKRSRHRRNESSISAFSDRFAAMSPQSMKHVYSTEKSLADELNLDDDNVSDLDELAGDDEKIVVDTSANADSAKNKARKILGLDVQDIKNETSTISNGNTRPSEPLVSPITETPTRTSQKHAFGQHIRASKEPGETHNQASVGYFPPPPVAELPAQRFSGVMPIYNYAQPEAMTPSQQKAISRYADAATQYEPPTSSHVFELDAASTRQEHALALPVPSISIQPPSTAPNSPRQSISLPSTTDAATQTNNHISRSQVDASMQTEEIRINRRRFNAHLLESTAIDEDTTRPVSLQSHLSNNTFQSVSVQEIATDLATKAIRETAERTALAKSPMFPEPKHATHLHDRSSFWGGQSAASSSMPVSYHEEPGIQSGQSSLLGRELRKSQAPEDPISHDVFKSRLRDQSSRINARDHAGPSGDNDVPFTNSARNSVSKYSNRIGEIPDLGFHSRSRASSIDSSGSESHSVSQQIPRFPVPDRSSSRVQSQPFDDDLVQGVPNGSPRSRRRAGDGSRPTGIRKSRSASSMTRSSQTSPTRRRRPVIRPPVHSTLYEDHPYEPSTNTYDFHLSRQEEAALRMNPTRALTPVEEGDDDQLIDAIASAMVGEWMWKYAQKRSSFGVMDNSKKPHEDTNRNKRWLWLSPHDRTIMWASKQPTSGSALMGRSSRKIRIKTVLDVKDENPAPKTSNNGMACFDRSIIILSPERALKITATSRERHYFWLMALSFLANPAQGPPKIPRLPSSTVGSRKNGAENNFATDNPVIEQSISRANANMLSQVRDVTSPVVDDGASTAYNFDTGSGAPRGSDSIYDRPDTSGSANDIRSIPRFRRNTQASDAKSKPKTGRRSSAGFTDLPTPLAALRSLTSRKSPSLISISSKTNKNEPLSPSFSAMSDHASSPSVADHASQAVGTVRMTAFVDRSREQHVQPEHGIGYPGQEAAGGLGLFLGPDENNPPRSPRIHIEDVESSRDRLGSMHGQSSRDLPPSKGFNTGGMRSSSLSSRGSQMSPIFGLPYSNKVGDGENASVSPSVATDDKRRLGYIFDDEGRDPFRGF
ncbi:hypothetical protein K461DRAFT_290115 [Myriangium duriaei CBS 260.36]|uniref:Pleckstrin homology domain-containing protein n=1 Tax=Myriangium duriaei CBS 260.36 TaxID=1168546 RepID=A0A9P4MST0_9PEZI|nr:hypothetical protein K461DRAFT_290115 [Myriangium duriaei CBS 260.36]